MLKLVRQLPQQLLNPLPSHQPSQPLSQLISQPLSQPLSQQLEQPNLDCLRQKANQKMNPPIWPNQLKKKLMLLRKPKFGVFLITLL
jgi:hypothetical protein